ncbi:hypothetical protein TNCV_2766081 [Trichonephila clavipes]|nr:hypothetical protein TNCV_2766081 [Trichonephila clavipes]
MITYDVEEEELEQDPFILPEDLRLLAPCGEHVRRLDDLLYLLELPWSKDSTCRSQIHHIHVPARMRCSSGDISEEYHDNASAWLKLCTTRCRWRYISNRRCMPLHI